MAKTKAHSALTPEQRFWSKVDKTATCWLWTAGKRGFEGYGSFSLNYKTHLTHRLAWEWLKGPLEPGEFLDHICKVRHCVNPKHLRIATPRENVLFNSESIPAKNRQKIACLRGHAFTKENTRIKTDKRRKSAGRACKKCHSLLQAGLLAPQLERMGVKT